MPGFEHIVEMVSTISDDALELSYYLIPLNKIKGTYANMKMTRKRNGYKNVTLNNIFLCTVILLIAHMKSNPVFSSLKNYN